MFNIHYFIGLLFLLGGIGLIASTFYVQKQEDKVRMPGFYTTAEILSIKRKNAGETAVTFAFTKDFKPREVTNLFPADEAEHWVEGRRALIVYDEAANKIYYNPMARYRRKQAILMVAGFLVLLFGVSWILFASRL